jgi:penicillin V acylase-like amidase (Ntn superfamily)
MNKYVDGLNEKGLSIGTLWLDETEYPTPASTDNALSIQDVGEWVLGNFATVAEVKPMERWKIHGDVSGPPWGRPGWEWHVTLTDIEAVS